MQLLLSALISLIRITTKLFFAVLPSILVLAVLTRPEIMLNRGVSVIGKYDHAEIHELFPNSSWNDLEPCGMYFDEQKEFNTALQCVNTKVWPESPIVKEEFTHIPRCFIVKAQGPNVFSKDNINFIPIFDLLGAGAIVGVYQPETRTVYVVENVDAAMVYRHELQHYFLHEHDPETGGGGHHQSIWEKCEPPYYTPSEKVQKLAEDENS